MNFINFAEMAGLISEGFARQEITSSTSNGTTTTTIYGGKAPVTDPTDADSRTDWKIQKSVIVDNGTVVTIQNTWAEGSWTNRASLTYKYL